MSLLTILNGPGQGAVTTDMPDLYLEWSPTTGPRETPVWERIPLSDIRSIDLNRGRNRELDRFQAGRMSVVLDNRLRRYDPQIGAQAQYVDLPGTSGNYASTPDSVAISITGDIDIRMRFAADDWTPAAQSFALGKEVASAQRSYCLGVSTLGRIFLRFSVDGTTPLTNSSTISPTVADGATLWVRITRVASTGLTQFFTAPDQTTTDTADVMWTQLGADVSGTAGALFDSTAALEIGSRNGGGTEMLPGNYYYAEVRNGIGPASTVVAKFDANTVPQQATRIPNTWTADDTGEVWTVNGSAWAWGGTWGSPHSGNVKPMRRIRLRAVWDTTYDLFSGFVDGWDQGYEMTNEATCTVTATDGFKVLGSGELLSSVYAEEIDVDSPAIWWRLNDGANATQAVDSVRGATATEFGTGQTFGAAGLVEGEAGTSYQQNNLDEFTDVGLLIDNPAINTLDDIAACTIEFVFNGPGPTGATLSQSVYDQISGADSTYLSIGLIFFGGIVDFAVKGTLGDDFINSTTAIGDDLTHHVACVYTGSELLIYVDGERDDLGGAVGNFGTVSAGNLAVIAGRRAGQFGRGPLDGRIQELAFYDYALSAERIAAHSDAVFAPWNGDTTGERIGRVLDAIDWSAAERDIDDGYSTLQSAELNSGDALEHAQLVRDTEFGELFMTPDGKVRFIARQNKWKPPYNTPIATLSDDGSDLGYGRLKFNYDDQLIRNKVIISYANGITFVANSTSSQDDFAIQSYSKTGLIGDVDTEAVDYANYVVGRYDEPLLRVEGVSITPQRDPDTMWPVVLSADLVYQVNVERTPQGVGSAIDIDYGIEGVSHHIEPKFWKTEIQLSPADTPGAFILDSTSQGILDTNVLGW